MKVIVFPNGEVTFETERVDQALEMVKGLRNGTHAPAAKKSRKKNPVATPSVEEVPLSPALIQTWEYLVANDSSSGTSYQELAKGMDIKPATATWRLQQLRKKGLVHRTQPGMYKPGEGADWPSQPPAE